MRTMQITTQRPFVAEARWSRFGLMTNTRIGSRLFSIAAGPLDPHEQRVLYQKEGWRQFDDKAPPYIPPGI